MADQNPNTNLVAMNQIAAFQDKLRGLHCTAAPDGFLRKRRRVEATPVKIELRLEQAYKFLDLIDSVRNGIEHGKYENEEGGAVALKRDLAMAQLMSMLVQGHGILLVVEALTQRVRGVTYPMAGFCAGCKKHQVGHKDMHDAQWYCDVCHGALQSVAPWRNKQIEGFQRFTLADQMADVSYLAQFIAPMAGMMMDMGTKLGAFTMLNEKGELVADGQGNPVLFPQKWIPDSLMESLAAETSEEEKTDVDAPPSLDPQEAVLTEEVFEAIGKLEGMPS